MEFTDELKMFAERVRGLKDNITTEESTKMSLIVPFFQLLGYDVFNPKEFCPEYIADVGIKKGEKVDYAIIENDEPVILIECKTCTDNLTKHASQLYRYFGTSKAKFGILTNGILYKFYTDLEETNKMDLKPFLEIDITALKDSQISELKKFCKSAFDSDKIMSTANELKYTTLMKEWFAKEAEAPSDDFVRLILSSVYEGQKTQKVIEKFNGTVKKSFMSYVNEIVNQRISSAISKEEEQEEPIEEIAEPKRKVNTTQEEIEAFYIVRGILAGVCPIEEIAHRDTESYFGILYQDNNRKPICRLNLDTKKKQIQIPDADKNFTRYYIENLNEIYQYKNEIVKIVKEYMK